MVYASPGTDASTDPDIDKNIRMFEQGHLPNPIASDSSDKSKGKLGQKTLRRLAQNREAARKSRLRKKAYVQQLENSRLKLNQLEQELQHARQQGIIISTSDDQCRSTSENGALIFNMEYTRWLGEQNKLINELRAAVHSHAGDDDLQSIVNTIMVHNEEFFRLKGVAAKADALHVLSGTWRTPLERCFLWLGGFRPSELLKVSSSSQARLCNRQQSSQEAEEALSQRMEIIQHSLAETIASQLGRAGAGSSGNAADHTAAALRKIGTMESLLQQADDLRLQSLQQMQRVLTTRQSARALLLVSDYFSRLRALSSLWISRPHSKCVDIDTVVTDP
ncbi:transcription factor TGAL1-like isoform X2 [Oryza brachyantha]|uniref:transcription factor TGAL1-like isoform X2 n=1 Tax=Oryza brachyantha TaxID=4533 RepID=UPI00077666C8|nr:transcription factor TGAL1-like isoform X2 [Oryza brachyantha]